MDKFVIRKETDKINSINRTIRFKPEAFEKISDLSEKYGISFNKIVVQCLDYALEHLDEPEE